MTVIFSAELLSTETRSSRDECSTGSNNHLLGLQVDLDHRSLSSIGQNILMILPLPSLLSYDNKIINAYKLKVFSISFSEYCSSKSC